MATLLTVNIPLATLPLGLSTFGPATIPLGVTWARIGIDRTVALGLNSLGIGQTFTAIIETSLDGGATWQEEARASTQGSALGNETFLRVQPINGDPGSATRQVRAKVDASAVVAVAGNLTAGN